VPLRAKPGRPAHNTVGTARLTCGQPRDHRLFPQVTAKREDLTRLLLGSLPDVVTSVAVACSRHRPRSASLRRR
jgi:hypothetical protein